MLGQILEYMRAASSRPSRQPERRDRLGHHEPEGTHSYQLQVADGTCTAVQGNGEPARVTLGMTLPDFLRFLTGQLDGMQAFMTGKLKLSGDMMFAQSMQAWFAQ